MKIIGITGSIASGKTTVEKWMNELGIKTHNSDRVVHVLLGPRGEAVEKVLAAFGSRFGNLLDGIDRKSLGDAVFSKPKKRMDLESILHPMVHHHQDLFIAQQRKEKALAVGLDIPLLFETGGESICDYVIVVHASLETITKRALSRPGMTKDKLANVLASQIPSDIKIKRADLILNSDLPKVEMRSNLLDWFSKIGLTMILDRHSKKQYSVQE